MKLKSGFVVRNIMDEYVVVPVGQRVTEFNGLITLNETGLFIWNKLAEKECTAKELVDAILDEYDIDEQTASVDVAHFAMILAQQNLLEKSDS